MFTILIIVAIYSMPIEHKLLVVVLQPTVQEEILLDLQISHNAKYLIILPSLERG